MLVVVPAGAKKQECVSVRVRGVLLWEMQAAVMLHKD